MFHFVLTPPNSWKSLQSLKKWEKYSLEPRRNTHSKPPPIKILFLYSSTLSPLIYHILPKMLALGLLHDSCMINVSSILKTSPGQCLKPALLSKVQCTVWRARYGERETDFPWLWRMPSQQLSFVYNKKTYHKYLSLLNLPTPIPLAFFLSDSSCKKPKVVFVWTFCFSAARLCLL